ncbi:MAG TPA: hypothetical protein VGO08_04400, partial [Burkholderiales bacterium]|nr:hypothetical protein [Burkholderiales bacterium]
SRSHVRTHIALNAVERRYRVNHNFMDPDELDVDADDLAPMGEIEFEEPDGVETDLEVELLLGRMQATRFSGA